MKISYNWLKDYVATDLTPTEISEILTETGLEVDGIEKIEGIKGGLQGVFVGEVLTCEKHPDADKLKITTVSVGGEPLQIVCGAPNVAVGQKVICATIGAVLYPTPEDPFKIKASKIRGVESFGMLCAEDELGLGNSHEGILVLPTTAKVGTPAAEYFELEDDYQIEIGLTPNRADAMGHIGVARDLVAYLNFHKHTSEKVNFPIVETCKASSHDLIVSVGIQEKELCPKYLGVTISNVVVKPSPNWLQKRLISVGLTPINSIVDCTNYVMRELGTPLHTFDALKLKNQIIVKKANAGDKIMTLD
ncbi:MAG: phenylalanine--tRNA ligase subunit beta, partial [Crocinitomicaceae bacterium]|nr:phenylalanine--tRNA ligase subunit beta [Crocinitomicaceae bacterium]